LNSTEAVGTTDEIENKSFLT